jgi:O-antigen/teichoic acid export membrane protein
MMINRVHNLLLHFRALFRDNSLFRNSIYLMGSTVVMSIMGFGFWVFVAHLYSPADIGNAAALISLSALITNLSLLGINSSLVRFLSQSKDQSRTINAAVIVVAAVTVAASLVYLLVGSQFSATARVFTASPLSVVLFVTIMVIVSINSLTDAVFIANRRAEFHTIAYGILGLIRLVSPLFLITYGSWGIFSAYILATLISLITSFFLMRRAASYRLFAQPDWSLISTVRKYGVNNYIGTLLAGIPSQVMPMLIVQNINAANAAFYSMAWTMANLLYIIPSATTQSLLAETSYDQQNGRRHLKDTVRMLTFILVPVIVISILVAPYLLSIFGAEYSHGSTLLFQVFALSTVFVAVNAVSSTILNIERRTFGIIVAQLATLIVTLGSVALLWGHGLLGVGLAMTLGLIASNLVYAALHLRRQGRTHRSKAAANLATAATIRRMVRSFGITDCTVKALPNGSNNQTLLITVKNTKYVLRVYKDRTRTLEQIQTEIDFMATLSNGGIPVPEIISSSKGQQVSQMISGGVVWEYIMMSFEPGSHPDTYSPTLLRNMARTQALIHRAGLQYSGQPSHPVTSLVNRLLGHLIPVGYSHFDFDGSNILIDRSQEIRSVLDFEGMRYGPLCICLYFSLGEIYKHTQHRESIWGYLSEYQKQRRLSRLERLFTSCALAVRFRSLGLLTIYKVA